MFDYEYEFETGLDQEGECEFTNEYESDQFLPMLLPALKWAAPMAIQAIGGLLGGGRRRSRQREFEFETPLDEFESEYEGGYEFETNYEGDAFIGNLLQQLGSGLGSLFNNELEFESEGEFETLSNASEYEIMMEHLAYQASQSESEAEAEAFLGALVPLAARLIPSAAKAITSVAPSILQGISRVGHTLFRNPATRQLLRTMPTVLKGTTRTLARQVAQGKPVSSKTALRALAGNVAGVLDNPRRVQQVMRRSHRAQHQARLMANRAATAAACRRKRRPVMA
jgi:hypothetical protein